MRQVTIGALSFSKVLCGTNAFWGHSHFSEARNAEYLGRFSDETIERTVRHCLALGINAVESCVNPRILSILARLRKQRTDPVRFVGSTRIDETSPIKSHPQKLALLIENRADICVVHAQYVDRPRKGDAIDGLRRFIDQIHEAGLLAGISTHCVATVELCERHGYGIDTYLFPMNLSGFVYPGFDGPDTVQDRVSLVRSVAKPFILIKTLGAGRIPPDEALHFIVENSKPNDIVSVGLGSEGEVAESVRLVEKYFPVVPIQADVAQSFKTMKSNSE